MLCQICNIFEGIGKSFSTHLQIKHSIKSIDYTIKYIYNNVQPKCFKCKKETRYVAYTFKEYCKEHRKLAESKGGSKGGKAPAWNKGLTRETDKRIVIKKGKDNPFYGKNHTLESIDKMQIAKRISRKQYYDKLSLVSNELLIITPYEEYFSRQHQYLNIICKQCGQEQTKTLQSLERGSKCRSCYPISTNSLEQKEIFTWLSDYIEIIENDTNQISPYELDIFSPSKKIAIEYNGLRWHTENFKIKEAHKEKQQRAKNNGIKLINIFSDEWKEKPDIVKSMILNQLGLIKNKIYARKCNISVISKSIEKDFLNSNHISGFTKSKYCLGLYYKNELVSILSLRVPIQKKYKQTIEIARFCSKIDFIVPGGFSKLLNHASKWSKNNNYTQILTYADLRFGGGNVYNNCGFIYQGETDLDYWYCDDKSRFNRAKFRAKNGKTEKEIVNELGLVRIYGCGSAIYTMTI